MLLCGNAPFTTDDLINRVEGQLLYDRMIDEAQIRVGSTCNVPHVVFSIVRPNYRECPQDRDKVHECGKEGELASECKVCQFVIAVAASGVR